MMEDILAKYSALKMFFGEKEAEEYLKEAGAFAAAGQVLKSKMMPALQSAKSWVGSKVPGLASAASHGPTSMPNPGGFARQVGPTAGPALTSSTSAVKTNFTPNFLRSKPPTPPSPPVPKPAGPGAFEKWTGRIGTGMAVAGAGQAFMGAADQRPPTMASDQSLTKQALLEGLKNLVPQTTDDKVDLAAYGLLGSGVGAQLLAPKLHDKYHNLALGADLAGLALLARHHIPLFQHKNIEEQG